MPSSCWSNRWYQRFLLFMIFSLTHHGLVSLGQAIPSMMGNDKEHNWAQLVKHDQLIDEFQSMIGEEYQSALFWAKLGELYFDRNVIWKQEGLSEALECFNRASQLIGAPNDDRTTKLQFAFSLQKGIILGGLGRSVEAIDMFDTALRYTRDSANDRATVLYQKASAMLSLRSLENPAVAAQLLNESILLNPCELESYWQWSRSLRANAKNIAKEVWQEVYTMFTTTLRKYFGNGDDASGYLAECKGFLQFMRHNEQRKEEVVYGGNTNGTDSSGIGDIDSDMDAYDDATDSLYSPTSVELLMKQLPLHWSLHLVADMLELPQSQTWSHLDAAHTTALLGGSTYSLENNRRIAQNLISFFTRDRGYWPPPELGMGSTSKLPVFIIGFFRSGSTLLETMLDAHPSIWGMGEESVFSVEMYEMGKEMFASSAAAEASFSDIQEKTRTASDTQSPIESNHENIDVKSLDIDAIYGLDATTGKERFGSEGFENVKGGLLQMGVEIGPNGEIRYIDKEWSKVSSIDEQDDLTGINADTKSGISVGSKSEGRDRLEKGKDDENIHNGRIHKRQLIDDNNVPSESSENRYVEIVNRRADNVIKRMLTKAKDFMIHDDSSDAVHGIKTSNASFTHIVDKMLLNYKNLALIHLVFPNAVILHTVRDPMDTLFSCYKNRFNDDVAMYVHNHTTLVAEYVLYLEIMAHFKRELPPGRIIDVSYEALVASPEAVLRPIITDPLQGLGLPWDPAVLRYHEKNRTVHTVSILQIRKSIYRSSVGIWRSRQQVLRPMIEEFQKYLPQLRASRALPSMGIYKVQDLGGSTTDTSSDSSVGDGDSITTDSVKNQRVPSLVPSTTPPSLQQQQSSPPSFQPRPIPKVISTSIAMNWEVQEGFDYDHMLNAIAAFVENGTKVEFNHAREDEDEVEISSDDKKDNLQDKGKEGDRIKEKGKGKNPRPQAASTVNPETNRRGEKKENNFTTSYTTSVRSSQPDTDSSPQYYPTVNDAMVSLLYAFQEQTYLLSNTTFGPLHEAILVTAAQLNNITDPLPLKVLDIGTATGSGANSHQGKDKGSKGSGSGSDDKATSCVPLNVPHLGRLVHRLSLENVYGRLLSKIGRVDEATKSFGRALRWFKLVDEFCEAGEDVIVRKRQVKARLLYFQAGAVLVRQRGSHCPALGTVNKGSDADVHTTGKDSNNAVTGDGGGGGISSMKTTKQEHRKQQYLDFASSDVGFDYQDHDEEDDNDDEDDCQNFAWQAARLYRRVLALDPLSLGPYLELVSALSESGIWKHHHDETNDQKKVNKKLVSAGERWYKLVVEMDKRIVDTLFDLITHPYEQSAMEKLLEDSLMTHTKQMARTQAAAEAMNDQTKKKTKSKQSSKHSPSSSSNPQNDMNNHNDQLLHQRLLAQWQKPTPALRRTLTLTGRNTVPQFSSGVHAAGKQGLDARLDLWLRRNAGVYWALYTACDHASSEHCSRDRAWRYLRSAKDIESYKLAEAEYNITDSYQRGREIQAAFTKESGFWDVSGSTSKLPVFIIGFFRSGSTLLETMLDAHPSIWGMGEESVFPQAVLSLNREIIALMNQAAQATKKLNLETNPTSLINQLKLIVDAHAAAIITAMNKRRQLFEMNFNDTFSPSNHDMNTHPTHQHNLDEEEEEEEENSEKNASNGGSGGSSSKHSPILRMVDKMLGNYKNLALIHLVFPNAVILHTVRDPMDTLFSCHIRRMATAWTVDPVSLITEYVIYLEIMAHFKRELPPGRIIDVHYESLVHPNTSKIVLQNIITNPKILNLPWDPVVMEFNQHYRPVHTASVLQIRQPVYQSSIKTWKKYAQQMEPLREYFKRFLPLLKSMNAWPEGYSLDD